VGVVSATGSCEAGKNRRERAAALRALAADDRELLMLVTWEGVDAGELAEVYACSRNAGVG
jgi:DNA-directed RNA polymerase specialized sigma24 family protein